MWRNSNSGWQKMNLLDLPPRIVALARGLGGLDSAGIRSSYLDAIGDAMLTYLSGDESLTRFRNSYKRAVLEHFDSMFYSGYVAGGGQISQMSEDDRGWLLAKINAELGYVDMLFQSLKALRKSQDTPQNLAGIAMQHAGMYARALDSVYAEGKARGLSGKEMYTLLGSDGKESCPECQRYKGQRHPIKWWRERGLIPSPGNHNYTCGNWVCDHHLYDDNMEPLAG